MLLFFTLMAVLGGALLAGPARRAFARLFPKTAQRVDDRRLARFENKFFAIFLPVDVLTAACTVTSGFRATYDYDAGAWRVQIWMNDLHPTFVRYIERHAPKFLFSDPKRTYTEGLTGEARKQAVYSDLSASAARLERITARLLATANRRFNGAATY